jgi:hypothetical protein
LVHSALVWSAAGIGPTGGARPTALPPLVSSGFVDRVFVLAHANNAHNIANRIVLTIRVV